jgi:hypothetical protein
MIDENEIINKINSIMVTLYDSIRKVKAQVQSELDKFGLAFGQVTRELHDLVREYASEEPCQTSELATDEGEEVKPKEPCQTLELENASVDDGEEVVSNGESVPWGKGFIHQRFG